MAKRVRGSEPEVETVVAGESEEAKEEAKALPKRLRYLIATYGEPQGRAKFAQEQEEKKILFP